MFPLSCHRSNEVLLDFRALTKSTVYTTKVHFQDNSNIFPAVYLVLLAESNIEVIHGNNLERPYSGQRRLIKNIYLFFFLLLLLLSRIKKLIFLDFETSLTRSSIGKKELFIFSLIWRQFPLLKQFKLLSWKRKAVSCLFLSHVCFFTIFYLSVISMSIVMYISSEHWEKRSSLPTIFG